MVRGCQAGSTTTCALRHQRVRWLGNGNWHGLNQALTTVYLCHFVRVMADMLFFSSSPFFHRPNKKDTLSLTPHIFGIFSVSINASFIIPYSRTGKRSSPDRLDGGSFLPIFERSETVEEYLVIHAPSTRSPTSLEEKRSKRRMQGTRLAGQGRHRLDVIVNLKGQPHPSTTPVQNTPVERHLEIILGFNYQLG
jgi:hypothetical protein